MAMAVEYDRKTEEVQVSLPCPDCLSGNNDLKGFQVKNATPYMHFLVYHVHIGVD